MTRTALLVGSCVCLVLLTCVSTAHADISALSPPEGTVGTQLTLSGSGFGQKEGKILVGEATCKVLAWSDSALTCVVTKPQPPGWYDITVVPHGQTQPSEPPLIFSSFAMRRPRIVPGASVRDGDAITIPGAFFGDKKGDVYLGSLENWVERAHVLDWNMDSIRVKLPRGLTGRFILRVRNQVGTALALVDLGGGPPLLGILEDPPGYGDDYDSAATTPTGIYYKGHFYVFASNEYQGVLSSTNYRIHVQTFDPTRSEAYSAYLPIAKGETLAQIAPLVIKDQTGAETLWVFCTGQDRILHYTRYDGVSWDPQWYHIRSDVTTSDNTFAIAPVYDPVLHRIYVYFESQGHLRRVFSDDAGASWLLPALSSGDPAISKPPSAVFHQGTTQDGKPYDALLAVVDPQSDWGPPSDLLTVYALKNGSVIGTVLSLNASNIFGRPFLMDDLGEDFIALLYFIEDEETPAVIDAIPMIKKLDKATGTWAAPYQALQLPTVGQEFQASWGPTGAINYELRTGGGYDRIFYLSFGWTESSAVFGTQGPFRWLTPLENLGPGL
jgi:IPT/TIG domain-containing protein